MRLPSLPKPGRFAKSDRGRSAKGQNAREDSLLLSCKAFKALGKRDAIFAMRATNDGWTEGGPGGAGKFARSQDGSMERLRRCLESRLVLPRASSPMKAGSVACYMASNAALPQEILYL